MRNFLLRTSTTSLHNKNYVVFFILVAFVVTCCNDALGYIPSMEGFDNNTYEANNGKFMPGTGEALADEYVKMLETLYATK